MESSQKIGQDRYVLKILTFGSIFVQKSTPENWTFAQFLSFEWRNGSQNRNVLEKLSGTGPFWKFWFFGQGQGSTWSKHFFSLSPLFFFFFCRRFGPGPVSRSVKPVSGGDVIRDVIALGACVARVTCQNLTRRARESAWGLCVGAWRRVKRRWWSPNLQVARGSAWLCILTWNFQVL